MSNHKFFKKPTTATQDAKDIDKTWWPVPSFTMTEEERVKSLDQLSILFETQPPANIEVIWESLSVDNLTAANIEEIWESRSVYNLTDAMNVAEGAIEKFFGTLAKPMQNKFRKTVANLNVLRGMIMSAKSDLNQGLYSCDSYALQCLEREFAGFKGTKEAKFIRLKELKTMTEEAYISLGTFAEEKTRNQGYKKLESSYQNLKNQQKMRDFGEATIQILVGTVALLLKGLATLLAYIKPIQEKSETFAKKMDAVAEGYIYGEPSEYIRGMKFFKNQDNLDASLKDNLNQLQVNTSLRP